MNTLIQPHSSLRANGRVLALCAIYPLTTATQHHFICTCWIISNHKGITEWIINYEGLRRENDLFLMNCWKPLSQNDGTGEKPWHEFLATFKCDLFLPHRFLKHKLMYTLKCNIRKSNFAHKKYQDRMPHFGSTMLYIW